jgi:putative membrane protein
MTKLAIAALVLLTAGVARPAEDAPEGAGKNLSAADRQFIAQAAAGGRYEVELGRLAQTNASSDQVRRFGQRMIDDHSKANRELMDIASSEGLKLEPQMKAGEKIRVENLGRLKGAAFDRRYMETMLQDHRVDIQEFQKAAAALQDARLRTFAQEMLPTLRAHLQLAQSVVNTTSGTSGAGRTGRQP